MSGSPVEDQRRAFGTTISASAAPYGYTVSIWSTGALLIHFRGNPNVWEIFLFALGAVAGYALLGRLGTIIMRRSPPLRSQSLKVEAGMFDWLAVGLSAGAAALLDQIPTWTVWPLSSALVTIIYITATSVQLHLAAARRSRNDESR